MTTTHAAAKPATATHAAAAPVAHAPMPTLTGVSPAVGDSYGGGRLTLTGTNLTGTVGVAIGGVAATGVAVVSSTSVTCVAPALAASATLYDVTLTRADAVVTRAAAYESWNVFRDAAGWRWGQADQLAHGATSRTLAFKLVARQVAGPFTINRDGNILCSLGGRLIECFGWNNGAFPGGVETTNQVLASDDGGATWVELRAHDNAPATTGPSALPTRAHAIPWCKHTIGGTEYLYVFGCDQYVPAAQGDVWRTADGITWERVCAASPLVGYVGTMAWSAGGALWCGFGQSDLSDTNSARNAYWKSTDGGATWVAQGNAPLAARSFVQHVPTDATGKAYVIAGGRYHNTTALEVYYNDVWTHDGATWTQVLANGHGQWQGRIYHAPELADGDGMLVVVRGFNTTDTVYGAAGNLADVLVSRDGGATWAALADRFPTVYDQLASGTINGACHACGTCLHNGDVVTLGGVQFGFGNSDDGKACWALEPCDEVALQTWTDLGPAGLSPTQATAGLRPAWRSGRRGRQPGVKFRRTAGQYLQLASTQVLPSGYTAVAVYRVATLDSLGTSQTCPAQTLIGSSYGSSWNNGPGVTGQAAQGVAFGAAWTRVSGGTTAADGAVHVVAVTHATDGTYHLSLDGALVATATITYNGTFTAWNTLGAGFGGPDKFFDGELKAWGVRDGVMPDAQLAKLSTAMANKFAEAV